WVPGFFNTSIRSSRFSGNPVNKGELVYIRTLVLIFLALFVPTIVGQTTSTQDQKTADRIEREARKQREKEQKERWKRRAEIEIGSSSDRVRSLVIQTLTSNWNFTLVQESNHLLLFQREMKGVRGTLTQAVMGNSSSSSPMHTVAFTVSEFEKKTRIQVDLSLQVRMALGNVN